MRRGMLVGLAVVLVLGFGSTGSGAATGNAWPATLVAGAASSTTRAVWWVEADGTVISTYFHGDAHRYALAQPIVGMAPTPSGNGYWLVASDGGVFAFGDARFFGSMAGKHLNAPIVGIAGSKYGGGYWLVAADGGIFTFGKAPFLGSLGGQHLDQPIVGMSAQKSGAGYRLVARDGGVFTFGQALFEGSLGGTGLTDVVGMATTTTGNGYWILRRNGGTYACGFPLALGGCGDVGPDAPEMSGPTVSNFGDAEPMQPVFAYEDEGGGRYLNGPDFADDPPVAIVGTWPRGFIVLRANGGVGFWVVTPPGA